MIGERSRARIRTWSRTSLTWAAAIALVLSATACGAIRDNEHPLCAYGGPTVLMAEAIPSASLVPCMRSLPIGWRFGAFRAGYGNAGFTMDSDVGGKGALRVDFLASCRTGSLRRTPSDQPGAVLYASSPSQQSGSGSQIPGGFVVEQRLYVFRGGCAMYRFAVPNNRAGMLLRQIQSAASFMTRRALDRSMRQAIGRSLYVPPNQG